MGGVIALLSIALTVVAIRMNTGVAGTLAALAVPNFVVAGVAQLLLRRYLVRPQLSIDFGRWWEILRSVLPLGVGGTLQRAYTRIDVWLLAALAGAAEAALFSVAYRVALQASDVSRLLAAALLPRISALAKTRREDLRTAVECLLRLLLVVSIAGAGLAAAFAAPLLMVVVGPEFKGSVVALRLVSVVCVTALPSAVPFLVLVALGRERVAVLAMAATVLWNGIIDIVLIPPLGVRGACFGTISAEWVCFGLTLYLVQKELRIPGIWQLFGRLVFSGVAMAAAIWMAGADRPVIGAVAGMAVFAGLCCFLRVVPRGSIRRLRRALAVRPDDTGSEVGALAESAPGAD
jgi:O-antigen/teichoic acid export membrane protein